MKQKKQLCKEESPWAEMWHKLTLWRFIHWRLPISSFKKGERDNEMFLFKWIMHVSANKGRIRHFFWEMKADPVAVAPKDTDNSNEDNIFPIKYFHLATMWACHPAGCLRGSRTAGRPSCSSSAPHCAPSAGTCPCCRPYTSSPEGAGRFTSDTSAESICNQAFFPLILEKQNVNPDR